MRISDWSSDVCSSDLLSALELARAGLLDVLASDYVPVSLLAATLCLAEAGIGITLPQAVRMASLNAARAAGLDDRGEIAPGKRADQNGRAHVCTPVTNAHLVCRLLPEKKKPTDT